MAVKNFRRTWKRMNEKRWRRRWLWVRWKRDERRRKVWVTARENARESLAVEWEEGGRDVWVVQNREEPVTRNGSAWNRLSRLPVLRGCSSVRLKRMKDVQTFACKTRRKKVRSIPRFAATIGPGGKAAPTRSLRTVRQSRNTAAIEAS